MQTGGGARALLTRIIIAVWGIAAGIIAAAAATPALAQPSPPSTFYGTVSIEGKPAPPGTAVRGFIDGKDCTQPGDRPAFTDSGVTVYVIYVIADSQAAGCGKVGARVEFRVGGRIASQSATWRVGPQEVNLNVGAGEAMSLPTMTATRARGGPAIATSTNESAVSERGAASAATATGAGAEDQPAAIEQAGEARNARRAAVADDGGLPVAWVGLSVLVGVLLVGGIAGVMLSRRRTQSRPTD